MAKRLKRSTKKLLSVGFHLALLTGMVLLYDGAKLVGQKFGWIEGDKNEEIVDVDVDEWVLSKDVDSKLAKLVDRNEDGYLFKRDMAFPPHLKVISTNRYKVLDARVVGKTLFEPMEAGRMSFKDVETMEYEMAGNAVRITMKKDLVERILTQEELLDKKQRRAALQEEGKPLPADNDSIVGNLQGKVVQFARQEREWKALKSRQFATAAWGKKLENKIAGMLVENGLVPRPRWFGEKRMKEGDALKLKDDTLSLIFDNVRVGSVEMVFLGMEGVHGHPCGVFEIKGTMVPNETVNDLGQTETSEVSIESGKAWLSLLYPVVMRVRAETIETTELQESGKSVFKLQGPVEKDTHLDWIAVVAANAKEKTPRVPEKKPVVKKIQIKPSEGIDPQAAKE